MNNLLAFMEALKGNSNFVTFTFVICGLCGISLITLSIQRTVRHQQQLEHSEKLEQKRIDAARSIVPVRQMGEDH